jgi:hypothetical protein
LPRSPARSRSRPSGSAPASIMTVQAIHDPLGPRASAGFVARYRAPSRSPCRRPAAARTGVAHRKLPRPRALLPVRPACAGLS